MSYVDIVRHYPRRTLTSNIYNQFFYILFLGPQWTPNQLRCTLEKLGKIFYGSGKFRTANRWKSPRKILKKIEKLFKPHHVCIHFIENWMQNPEITTIIKCVYIEKKIYSNTCEKMCVFAGFFNKRLIFNKLAMIGYRSLKKLWFSF